MPMHVTLEPEIAAVLLRKRMQRMPFSAKSSSMPSDPASRRSQPRAEQLGLDELPDGVPDRDLLSVTESPWGSLASK